MQYSWNVMAHGDARDKKWRGNKKMECVASKRHMTAVHRLARAVKTLQADVSSSPASSRLNWRPRRFKWTRPFCRKTKSGFCACAITFQTQSTDRKPTSLITCCPNQAYDDTKQTPPTNRERNLSNCCWLSTVWNRHSTPEMDTKVISS